MSIAALLPLFHVLTRTKDEDDLNEIDTFQNDTHPFEDDTPPPPPKQTFDELLPDFIAYFDKRWNNTDK
jgi:hypothetical protein